LLGLLALILGQTDAVPTADVPADVVIGATIPPHCHPRPGDPLDNVRSLPDTWVTLRLRRDGSVSVAHDALHFEQDLETWQRSGKNMGDYVFRVPTDGSPLCMGSRNDRARGGVQLRRQLDPRDFRGQHVRFTAFAASRNAKSVTFWVNGGGGEKQFAQIGWGGTHGWTPVSIDVYVSDRFPLAIYGFTLSGGGDVWLYQPRIDLIGRGGKPLPNQPDKRRTARSFLPGPAPRGARSSAYASHNLACKSQP